MNKKQTARLRRSRKLQASIKRLGKTRLCVHRSNTNIYAYLTTPCGSKIIASASSLDLSLKQRSKSVNKQTAAAVGRQIAEKGIKAGIKKVAFDRRGYKYHGRIQALADAARETGIEF